MPDRSKEPKAVDLGGLVGKEINFEVRTAETKDERESRLRREEAEDAHRRRISLVVLVFVMAMVTIAFLVSSYIAATGDPKSGLTEKAMNVITAIVAAGVGFITGKGSK